MTTVRSAVRSAFLLLLIFLALLLPLLTGGCATTTTRLQPVAPERVEGEERVQRELVLTRAPPCLVGTSSGSLFQRCGVSGA